MLEVGYSNDIEEPPYHITTYNDDVDDMWILTHSLSNIT